MFCFSGSKTPFNTDPIDKPKFDLISDNELNDQWNDQSNDVQTVEPDPNVSVFNLNVRDDRKTHKRDIEHKNQTDIEAVVATVVEITEMAAPTTITTTTATASTAYTPAIESLVQTATEIPETEQTSATASIAATTSLPLSVTSTSSTTAPPPSTTSTTENSPNQSGFKPILNVYYGGAPNEYANYVYFTTSEPAQNFEAPTEMPQLASDRNDYGKFRPSIQYDYRNYRYDTDNHFVPIVGAKQIF